MLCPKCGFEQDDGGEECSRCGVIFRKVRSRPPTELEEGAEGLPPPSAGAASDAAREAEGITLRGLFLPPQREVSLVWFVGRVLVFLGLGAWSVPFLLSSVESGYAMGSFLHGVNLAFHEAGHILFRPLGAFMTVLGGSLLQVLMPLICVGAFLLKERNAFGASVATWWAAESLMDLAPYIADARARVLPLLGGVTGRDVPGYHDWEAILGRLGWAAYDVRIAQVVHGLGVAGMLATLAWGGAVLWSQGRNLERGVP